MHTNKDNQIMNADDIANRTGELHCLHKFRHALVVGAPNLQLRGRALDTQHFVRSRQTAVASTRLLSACANVSPASLARLTSGLVLFGWAGIQCSIWR